MDITALSLPFPPGAGVVGGVVVDPMGSPMAAAGVTVTALDTHRMVARGTTDPYGLFLAALPPGRESAGNHFRPGELPLLDMYLTGVTLRIARDNVRGHIPDALELARSGLVDPARVVSHVLGWEQLPDALPEKHLKPVCVRAVD